MSTAHRAIIIFLPLVLLGGLVIFLLYRAQYENASAVLSLDEDRAVALGVQALTVELDSVVSDLHYLSAHPSLHRWLRSDDAGARAAVAADYAAFATQKARYERIRLVTPDGQEAVRIDWDDDTRTAGPAANLRSGAVPDFIAAALRLGPNAVHVSAFELDTEDGVIVQPIVPLIRFASPIYEDGQLRGAVVLSYRGRRLIELLQTLDASHDGSVWLVNDRGYWLLGPTPEDEWAFMRPDGEERSMARAYPLAWDRLRQAERRVQFKGPGGLFVAAPVQPTASENLAAAERWILVSHVSEAALADYFGSYRRNYIIAAAALAAILAVAAWLIAQYWSMRRAAQHSLRERELQFRTLIESAPDAVIVINETGRIELTNAETQRLFGYPREALIGQPVEMLIPERFRHGHVAHRAGYAAAPRTRPMGAGLDLWGRRNDGTEFPVAISLSPINIGERKMVFCDIRDVTEQAVTKRQIQELNEQLQRDNAALESVNKELEAFSYSVSHDLRSPLRAIDGFSQALQEDYGHLLDETGQGYLHRVRQAAQRMGMLIDDLIKLARVSRTELVIDEVDLSEIARDILDALAESAPERVVRAHIEPGLKARGDARLIRVALENLLGNAWKFTAGRDPAQIAFGRDEDEADGVAYYVRDNGAGFDMAYAGKLFGAFQRLHDAHEFDGTGIGLATVQRIIHKHGGRIWAEAAPGQGATFRFTL